MREYEKHVRTVHNDLEQLTKCPRADECGSDKVFTNKTNLRMHLEEQHAVKNEDMPKYVEKAPADPELAYKKPSDPFSSKCVVSGCQSQVTFTGRAAVRQHLVQVHKNTVEDARDRAPLLGLWKPREKPPGTVSGKVLSQWIS